MPKNIEPKLKPIGDYLTLSKDVSFVIPEYQRAYSWKIENCDKLWQDILDYEESESKDGYFFGTIIISCENNDTRLSLIDGQQRTTTFLLLLKALLMNINIGMDKTKNDEESEGLYKGLRGCRQDIMKILYRVESEDIPDNPNYEKDAAICQSTDILTSNSINENSAFKSDLTKILNAVNFKEAESNVHQIKYRQGNNRYTNFFLNFKYFYDMAGTLGETRLKNVAKTIIKRCEIIEVRSWQVEQAINMFNSLNSDGMPLLDADIIAAQLYAQAQKNNVGEEFNKRWKELLELANELDKLEIATIDSILLQQMYYERALNKEIISPTGAINVTTPGVRRYFKDINPKLLEDPIGLCGKMISLSKKWLKLAKYPIAQVLLKFNKNAKLFVASYLYRFDEDTLSKQNVKTILECMLRLFAILEVVDTGYASRSFKIFLFGEHVKLVDSTVDVAEIKHDFDEHIQKNWDKKTIKDTLTQCESQPLVYLNELLFARENDLAFNIGAKCDIEHIMPSSGKNIDEIRKDAKIETKDDFYATVNQLGNKILLETKINRSLSHDWFGTKVHEPLSDKTGYVDSQYPIAQKLVEKYRYEDKPSWTKQDIENATEKAAERIANFIFGI